MNILLPLKTFRLLKASCLLKAFRLMKNRIKNAKIFANNTLHHLASFLFYCFLGNLIFISDKSIEIIMITAPMATEVDIASPRRVADKIMANIGSM